MLDRTELAVLGADAPGIDASTGRLPAPGKVTLTARLPGHAVRVQRAMADAEVLTGPPDEDPFAMHLVGDGALDQALARGGGGAALPDEVRRPMEEAFDRDFSAVRIHTDAAAAAAAAAIGARAFTAGHDIYFAAGAFSLDDAGRRLLAHELAHVVQHGEGRTGSTTEHTQISRPHDALEREAEARADQVMKHTPSATIAGAPRAPSVRGAGASRQLFRFAVFGSEPQTDGLQRVLVSGSGPGDVASGIARTMELGGNRRILVVYGRECYVYDASGGSVAARPFHFINEPPLYPAIYVQPQLRQHLHPVVRSADGQMGLASGGAIQGSGGFYLNQAIVEQAAFDQLVSGHPLIVVVPAAGGGGGNARRNGGGGGNGQPPAARRGGAIPTSAPHEPAPGSTEGTRESGAPGQGGTRQSGEPSVATEGGYQGPGQRGDLPAYPSHIEGSTLVPMGADSSFEMRMEYGADRDFMGAVAQGVNGAAYRWERYRVEHSEEIEGTLAGRDGQRSAEADVLHRDRDQHLADNSVGAGETMGHDASRTWGNIRSDNRRAQQGLANAIRGDGHSTAGQRASAALANLVSLSTSHISGLVRMAGVVGRLFTGPQGASQAVHFDEPGVYVVRCVAQPHGGHRVASVAIRIVRVENIDRVARNALDQPRRDLSDAEVDLAAGRGDRAELESRRDNLRIEVNGTAIEVLDNRRTQLLRRQAESTDSGYRAVLQHEIDTIDNQLRSARENAGSNRTWRLRAAFADQESGQSYPLLLQITEPVRDGNRYRATVVDVTTAEVMSRSETSDDVEATPSDAARRVAQQDAIWRACRVLAGAINLGRGRMIVHMPSDPAGPFTADAERFFDVVPTDWNLARQRLEDVATAASMIALVVPGAQALAIAGGIAGGIAAAQRLWNRSEAHALNLSDPGTLSDIFSVISAIAQVPGMIGNARVFQNAGRLAVVVRTIARGAEIVDTAANWVGFAVNTGETLDNILRINAQERHGDMTHNEAAIQRNNLFLSLMRDSAMQVMSPPEHGEESHPAPHTDAPAGAHPPAAGAAPHVDPSAGSHPNAAPPAGAHPPNDPPAAGAPPHVDPPAAAHPSNDPPVLPSGEHPHVVPPAPPSGGPPQGGAPQGPGQPPQRGLPMRLSTRPHDNNQLSGNTHLSADAARAEHARRTRMDHDATAARAAIARELPHSTGAHENGWMSRPNETANVIPIDSSSRPTGVEGNIYDPPTARGTRPEPLSHSIAVGNGDYVHQVATGERVTVTTPRDANGRPLRHDILRSTGFCSCAGIAVRARGPHGESLTIGHAAESDGAAADGGQYSRMSGEVLRALDGHATDVAVFANIDREATQARTADTEPGTALHSFPADTGSLLSRMRDDVAQHVGPGHTVTVERGGLVIVGPDGDRRTITVGVQLRPVQPGTRTTRMTALQVTSDGILATDQGGGVTHWPWDALPGPYVTAPRPRNTPDGGGGGGTPPSNPAPPAPSGGPGHPPTAPVPPAHGPAGDPPTGDRPPTGDHTPSQPTHDRPPANDNQAVPPTSNHGAVPPTSNHGDVPQPTTPGRPPREPRGGEAVVHADPDGGISGPRRGNEPPGLHAATRAERDAAVAAVISSARAQLPEAQREAAAANAAVEARQAQRLELLRQLRDHGIDPQRAHQLNHGDAEPNARESTPEVQALLERWEEVLSELPSDIAHRGRADARVHHLQNPRTAATVLADLRPRTPGNAPPVEALRNAPIDVLGLTPPPGARFQAEHIVPASDIVLMDGFLDLLPSAQLEILNSIDNLVSLHGDVNRSRNNTPWSSYEGWTQWATPQNRERMEWGVNHLRAEEARLRPIIQQRIDAARARRAN